MLADDTKAEISAWNTRKLAQWEWIVPGLEGLQLARCGEAKSSFMLTYSTPDFYESVLIGQLPQVHNLPKNPKRPAIKASDWRPATEPEKPRAKRRIDLSDREIDSVLGVWRKGVSALTLPFVESVWRQDGKEYTL